MFDLLARFVSRWPKTILLVTLVVVGLGAVAGADVGTRLQTAGYTDPAAESSAARAVLDRDFAAIRPNLALLVTAPGGVDSPAAAAEGRRLARRLAAEPDLVGVTSYWQTRSPDLRSRDRTEALIVARLRAGTGSSDARGNEARAEELRAAYRGAHGPVRVAAGGSELVDADLARMAREDIHRAELIGIPIIAVILMIVFHGLIASFLPLLIGISGIIGTTAALRVISGFTDVSVFALNLAVGLGLGLAVDYALFIVRRHREELRKGADVATALRLTLNTAGRTVAFSALTVVVSMSAMLLFPMYFLRSFAYAGISVVVLAAVAALVPLSAALAWSGERIDALDVPKLVRTALGRTPREVPPGSVSPSWRRIAEVVTRRPVAFAVVTVALLATFSSQFLHLEIGIPDDRALPAATESHRVQQHLRDDFAVPPVTAVDIVAEGADRHELDRYAQRISTLGTVRRVVTVTGIYSHGRRMVPAARQLAPYAAADTAYLAVTSEAEPISAAGKALTRDVRRLSPPFGVLVGGASAELLDTQDSMLALFPAGIGLIALTTLVLLFLLSGSILVPVKALLMNVLSLTATFGVLVWIFQDGHLAGLLGFQVTGWMMVQLMVLLFTVAFGVSMDYEVFLISRIKEEYVRHGDNHRAVVFGIERTGGVVTAAALITAVVFTAMASSRVTHIKMFGIGLAVAVLMDAFVVRALLVPALMQLAGRANWWAPRPLRRVYDRFGVEKGDEVPLPVVPDEQTGRRQHAGRTATMG
jgi:RND superfamily putative drug exporter